MKRYGNLYQQLCSTENLELAFRKARKRKSKKQDVKAFEINLEENLAQLQVDLSLHSYEPKPLETFVIRDPKTRKIRKADFRDRVVHHAICNILEPIFDKLFISDSFANRKGKGSSNALLRFDEFKRKVSKNNTRTCFVFKADIKHYFDEVSHDVLLSVIQNKIKDERVVWLITKILKNHSTAVGMPLGNMTSQFFANIYLNELDQFVKHKLHAKHYVRYVDDFVILHHNQEVLQEYWKQIDGFLKAKLQLSLHSTKCKILRLQQGIPFLGFRNFGYYRLLRKTNIRTMRSRISEQTDYDSLSVTTEGWMTYAGQADTFNLRQNIASEIENRFPGQISELQIDRLRKQV